MTKEDWIFSTFVAHMQSSFFNSFASLLSLYDLTMQSICIAYKLRFLKNLQYEKALCSLSIYVILQQRKGCYHKKTDSLCRLFMNRFQVLSFQKVDHQKILLS